MKRSILLCLISCISLCASAQATDLEVDCQTPGWLSSKINYGDQQTVKNLKVTGYINTDDLKFIGQLIGQETLNGHIDLSEVNVVGNRMDNCPFAVYDKSIQRLDLPKSVTAYSYCLNKGGDYSSYLSVDTLVFDPTSINYVRANFFDKVQYGKAIKNLVVGEKVDSIPGKYDGFWEYKSLQSVFFKGKLRYIGDYAFNATPSLSKMNFEAFDSLEYIGNGSLSGSNLAIDTLYQPKKIVNFPILNFPCGNNAHFFFDTTLKSLTGVGTLSGSIFLHFKTMTPPACTITMRNTITIHVPKGAKEAYLKNDYFKEATIIEDNPITELNINEHSVVMNIGEKYSLSVLITPQDADDKRISWISNNSNVVNVDENGVVTAITSGEAKVYAVSIATGIKDSCNLLVRKNVEAVSFNEKEIVFNNIGETKKLEIVITPEDATEKSVTWKSLNEQVCTVSSEGLITAIGAGTTAVTATTMDGGYTATCNVKVIQHVASVSFEKHSLSLKVGDTEQMYTTISPANADEKSVTWSSSNEQIVSIDTNGNVKALKAGEAWIKAVSADNAEAKDSCKITVTQPVTGITLSKESHTFDNAGEKLQLTVTVLPEDATNKEVRWISSNENVCIVQNGLVTAIAAGTATVTVTTVDGSFTANCIIKVVQHVSKVELNKLTLSLKVDESERLTATISPDNAEDKTVVWSSSNEQVATVDANGNVKALKAGEAWIKAVSVDNAEAKDSCKVTVKQPVTGISLSLETIRLTNIGENIQLEATVLPEDASNKEVKWTSSNESVCVVANGKVIATGFGTTVVMATTIDGGFMASCAVVVEKETISVTSVEISQLSASLKKGETLQLSATVKPENATNKNVIWKSSNENVCAVTQTGLVVAIGEGKTIITVVPENGVGQAQCEVNVTSIEDAITDIFSDGHPSKQTVYDMMGRKVTHLVKGHLYIRNGQKFMAK